jgi:hypothetical protein
LLLVEHVVPDTLEDWRLVRGRDDKWRLGHVSCILTFVLLTAYLLPGHRGLEHEDRVALGKVGGEKAGGALGGLEWGSLVGFDVWHLGTHVDVSVLMSSGMVSGDNL